MKLAKFLVKGLMPISIVRQKGFREFCEILDPQYVLPTTQTLRKKLIPELDAVVMNEVRDDLKKIRHVAMTSDGWSARVCYIITELIFQIASKI